MKKKVLSIILTVTMLLGMIPLGTMTAFAETSVSDDILSIIDLKGVEVTKAEQQINRTPWGCGYDGCGHNSISSPTYDLSDKAQVASIQFTFNSEYDFNLKFSYRALADSNQSAYFEVIVDGGSVFKGNSGQTGTYQKTLAAGSHTVKFTNIYHTSWDEYCRSYIYGFSAIADGQLPYEGTGEEATPYCISSLEDMETLATIVNTGKNDFTNKYFKLIKDITGLTTAIGTEEHPFNGFFDGNGHTVYLTNQGSGLDSVFGARGNNANIHDLNVVTIGQLPTHTHTDADGNVITFNAWTDSTSLPTSGNWYLTVDVQLPGEGWNISNDVNLCLNGHIIALFRCQTTITITDGATFSLYDCGTTEHKFREVTGNEPHWEIDLDGRFGTKTVTGGVITGVYRHDHSVQMDTKAITIENGTFNMYGGNICGNYSAQNQNGLTVQVGGSATIGGSSQTFNMYGGAFCGNYGYWGCVQTPMIRDFGHGMLPPGQEEEEPQPDSFNMYGGKFYENSGWEASAILAQGPVSILGGEICNNLGPVAVRASFDETGTVTIGGSAVISDNNGGNLKAIRWQQAGSVTFAEGEYAPKKGMHIGLVNPGYDGNTQISTTYPFYMSYLFSDDSSMCIKYNSENEWLELAQIEDGEHKISIEPTENGNALYDHQYAKQDERVQIHAIPDSEDYIVKSVKFNGQDATEKGNNIYYFSMPDEEVTVSVEFAPAHTHAFSYEASNNVIIATCSADDCPLNAPITLTLTKNAAANYYVYDGSAKTVDFAADEATAWKAAVGSDAPTITCTAKEGSALTDGKAVNAGSYTATITVDTDKTATLDFTIEKASLTATASSHTVTYGAAVPSYTVTYTGWKNGEETPTTAAALSSAYTATSNVGSYDVSFSTEPVFTNYAVTTVKGAVTVGRAATAVEPIAADRTYTGEAQNGYSDDGDYVTLTGTPSATDAGDYEFTATPDGNHAWEGGSTEPKIYTWKIARANYTGTTEIEEDVEIKAAVGSTATVELPELPKDASYAASGVGFSSYGTATVANGKLTLTVGENDIPAETETFDVTVAVTGAKNYEDYEVTVHVTPVYHTHGSWSYAADGATITATCGEQGCDSPAYSETLTISAPTGTPTYDGATTFPATLTSTAEGKFVGAELPTISYEKKNASGSYEAYSGEPKDAGAYKASVTVGEKTACVEFTVAKRDLTANDLTVTVPENAVYDGLVHAATAALKTATPQLTGLGQLTIKYQKKTGDTTWGDATTDAPKAAGTYKVLVSAEVGDNFNATANDLDVSKQFIIAPRPVTLVAKSASKAYDGNPLTNNEFTVKEDTSFVSGEGVSVTMTAASTITDVGSVDNEIDDVTANEGTDLANYTITKEKGTLTVTAAALTVTATAYEAVYDGEPHNISYTVTDANEAAITPDAVYFREGSSGEWIPAADFSPYTDVCTKAVQIKVSKANYADATDSATLTIKPKTVELIWSTIGEGDNAYKSAYDGTEQTSKITASYEDIGGESHNLVVAVKQSSTVTAFKNAGTYTAEVTGFAVADIGSSNYALPEAKTQTYTMDPKALTAEVTATKVYDGTTAASATQVTATVATGITGETLTISGVTGTFNSANVADCTTVTPDGTGMSVTAGQNTDKANYTVSMPQSGTGTITAFNLSGATVTLNKTEVSYTGNPITSDITVTVKDGNNNVIPSTDYKITYTNNTNAALSTDTNAPTVTITPADSNTNVSGEISEKFTITKAQTLPEGTPTEYDINAVTSSTLSLSDIGITLDGAKITDVAAVSGQTGKVLDGAPTIVAPDNTSISWTTVKTPSGTDSDQYKLTISSNNYEDFDVTVSFTGKIVVTFDESAKPVNGGDPITYGTDYTVSTPTVYDGQETPTVNFTYTYYENAGTTESPDWKKLETKPTDAGDYKVEISVNDNKYTGSKGYEYTIAKKQVEVIWGDTALTYDPAAIKTPSATYQLLARDGGGTPDLTVTTDAADTNVGTFTASAAFNAHDIYQSNYELIESTATQQYAVSPKAVNAPNITLTPVGEKKYTGNPVTLSSTEIELKDGNAVIPNTEYTVSYQNNTNAGTAILIITDKEGGNYTVSGQTTFTIVKAAQKAPTAPSVSGNTVTIAEADREKKLEYSLDSENAWISVPTLNGNNAFTLSGLTVGSHTIYLREKESSNYFASPSVSKAFELTQYSVAYNANGGVGSIASQTANSGSSVTVKSGSAMSRTGYTFTGWKDENGTSHAAGSTVSTGMTLYAQWTANTYTVRFNANGGSGAMTDQSFTYDAAKALTANAFTRTSYTFIGWATSANGPVLYSDAQSVKNLASSGTVTLYAIWAQDVYKIDVNITSPQGGNVQIKLQQGNAVYAVQNNISMNANDNKYTGSYSFTGVPAGTYNIEVTQTIEGDKNVTMTQLVVLNANSTANIDLPTSGINSKLEVEEDTLPTVVGGLEKEAEANRQTGKDITVKMTVEKKEEQQLAATASEQDKATQDAISEIKATANGRTLDFMNIEIEKTTVETGKDDVTEAITETSSVLELVFSYEMNGKKNIQIYRQHGDEVQTFEKLNEKPTAPYRDGTFYVDTANSLIYVYASSFSTYAIGYEQQSSGGGSGGSSSYAITVNDAKNGTVSTDKKTASAGQTVTITVTPDKGFTLETLTVLDKNGKEVEIKNLGNNKYSFKMPSGKVSISATFMEDNTMLNFFVDVKASDYFYDAVLWAAENGITKGTDAVHFSPYVPVTRAQVVTFLWRTAGCPEPKGDASKFVDVPANEYYAKAVAWAIEQVITKGTSDTTFSPDKVCTRGQIVTFLARFAGVADEAAGYTHGFTDVKATDYFNNAVAWAKDNKVTEGTSATTFSPNDDCTRAQVVTFLYRWMVK